MGGELCAAGPAVEEGPKLPAGRLNKTAARWKRTPCPSGRGGKWRRTGKVDRWRELGDARRAAVCERGRGGQHFAVAWAGRHGRDGPIVLRGLRDGGTAKGPDGTKGFRLLRTRQVGWAEILWVETSRLIGGVRQVPGSLWEEARWTLSTAQHRVETSRLIVGVRQVLGSLWEEARWTLSTAQHRVETSRLIGGVRQELGSLWEEARSWWRRNRSEALRVAMFALFVAFVQVVTGVGCIVACFLAVLFMLPCAFFALVFAAGCAHVWTLVRRTPSMAHIEAPAGTYGWRCSIGGCYATSCLLGDDEGDEEEEEEEEEEIETEDACAFGRRWCRHTGGLSRKRTRTAAAETGCRRRKASAQLQSKVWDPGRSLGAKCLAEYSLT